MSGIEGFVLTSAAAFTLSSVCFRITHRHFDDSKQKAWIVTFLSSTIMAIGSLPFIWNYLRSHGDVLLVPNFDGLSRTLCASFQGFLLSDLAMGHQCYSQHLSPAIGWGHHITYAAILPYITYRGWAHVFALCLAMELPTCMLAASVLFPKVRNDMAFALLFFTTRVVFHTSLFIAYLKPRGRNGDVDGSYIPALLLAMALLMHLSWFVRSVCGILRRRIRSKSGTTKRHSSQATPQASIGSRPQHDQIQIQDIICTNIQYDKSASLLVSSYHNSAQSARAFPSLPSQTAHI